MKPGFERLSYWSRTFASCIEIIQWLCAGFAVFLGIGIVWLGPSVFVELAQAFMPGVTPPLPVAILIIYALLASAFFGSVLTAKMWQYIRKIFEISAGNAPNSIGPTPFQPENVRLLKKIASPSSSTWPTFLSASSPLPSPATPGSSLPPTWTVPEVSSPTISGA